MLGTSKLITSSMLDMDDGNFTNDNSSLYVQSVDDKDVVRKVDKEDLDYYSKNKIAEALPYYKIA